MSVAELRKKFQEENEKQATNIDADTRERQSSKEKFASLQARFQSQSDTNTPEDTTIIKSQEPRRESVAEKIARMQKAQEQPSELSIAPSENVNTSEPRRESVAEKIARLKQKQIDSGKELPIMGMQMPKQTPFKKRQFTSATTSAITNESKSNTSPQQNMTKYKACDVCECPLFIKHPLKDICKDCDHPHPQIWVPKTSKPKSQQQAPIIQFGLPPAGLPKRKDETKEETKFDMEQKYGSKDEYHGPGNLEHLQLSRPSGPKRRHVRKRSKVLKMETLNETKDESVVIEHVKKTEWTEEEKRPVQKSLLHASKGDYRTPNKLQTTSQMEGKEQHSPVPKDVTVVDNLKRKTESSGNKKYEEKTQVASGMAPLTKFLITTAFVALGAYFLYNNMKE